MADLISTGTSGYATGSIDTATVLVNNVSPTDAKHPNGCAAAIVQIEGILGSGTTLKGNKTDLGARLAVALTADGIIDATGAAGVTLGDSRTNTTATVLTLTATTSGTPAAGIGVGILLRAESQDEAPSDFGQTEFIATDVGTGTEDTAFQILTRVAGAALTATYRWVATGAFKAIFTHANSADRTYTLPNYDGTVATLAGTESLTNKTVNGYTFSADVGTSALKTATGSATVTDITGYAGVTVANVTMNDYAFAWSCTQPTSGIGQPIRNFSNTGDPGNTVGRIQIVAAAADVTTLRWRYVTASDEPTIWVVVEPVTGELVSSWVSDDPPSVTEEIFVDDPNEGLVLRKQRRVLSDPPITVAGFQSVQIPLAMLSQVPLSQVALDAADRHIERHRLNPDNRLYRALQFETRALAPSGWITEHCIYKASEFRIMTAQERAEKNARRIPKAER